MGVRFMRVLTLLFALALLLLINHGASAQEAQGWLGADVADAR
jgi:hypothetical protein